MMIGVQGASKNAKVLAGEKLANVVEIAQTLYAAAPRRLQRRREDCCQDPLAQPHVQLARDAHKNPRPDRFENPHHGEHRPGQQRQDEQGLVAPARQHAVVDLHHVERRDQHQQVDEEAEPADGDEGIAAGRQRFPDFRLALVHGQPCVPRPLASCDGRRRRTTIRPGAHTPDR
ncbi:MAG TPA: hypothetical protein VF175_10385 [Lacipirellula sp.]